MWFRVVCTLYRQRYKSSQWSKCCGLTRLRLVSPQHFDSWQFGPDWSIQISGEAAVCKVKYSTRCHETVHEQIEISKHCRSQINCRKRTFPAGLEPATFRVWGGRDNHYTTETSVKRSNLQRKHLWATLRWCYNQNFTPRIAGLVKRCLPFVNICISSGDV